MWKTDCKREPEAHRMYRTVLWEEENLSERWERKICGGVKIEERWRRRTNSELKEMYKTKAEMVRASTDYEVRAECRREAELYDLKWQLRPCRMFSTKE